MVDQLSHSVTDKSRSRPAPTLPQAGRTFDEILQGFSLYKLHCVEIALSASAQMARIEQDRSNGMPLLIV